MQLHMNFENMCRLLQNMNVVKTCLCENIVLAVCLSADCAENLCQSQVNYTKTLERKVAMCEHSTFNTAKQPSIDQINVHHKQQSYASDIDYTLAIVVYIRTATSNITQNACLAQLNVFARYVFDARSLGRNISSFPKKRYSDAFVLNGKHPTGMDCGLYVFSIQMVYDVNITFCQDELHLK